MRARLGALIGASTLAALILGPAVADGFGAPARASWYGPGLYGNGTACGQTYSSSTWGVAHKWLPCGTLLDIRYNGRTAKAVPVNDRGPFTPGRDYDLSAAVAGHLGFSGVRTVDVAPHVAKTWHRAVKVRGRKVFVRCARSWDDWVRRTTKRGPIWVRGAR